MKKITIIYSILIIFGLPAVILATSSVTKEYTCPLDETKFEGSVVVSTNTFGGWDSDFCSYAIGDSPLGFYVQTCPKCLFSAGKDFFEYNAKLTDEEKKKLYEKLVPEVLHRLMIPSKPGKLTKIDKYDLAVKCSEVLYDKEIDQVGMLFNASWYARHEVVSDLVAPMARGLSKPPKEVQEEVEKKLKQMNIDEKEGMVFAPIIIWENSIKDYSGLDLLKLYHRLGFYEKQEALMKQLLSDPKQKEEAGKLKTIIEFETKCQKALVEKFKAALEKKQVGDEEINFVYYQIAEQNRRAGNSSDAKEWYKKTLQRNNLRIDIIYLCEYGLAQLNDNFRLDKTKRDVKTRERLDTLISELKDPAKTSEAHQELIAMAQKSLLNGEKETDGILQGLKSSDINVRCNTSVVLKYVKNKNTIPFLVKVMLEDKESCPRGSAAEALSQVADFSAVEPLVKALSDNEKDVFQYAIEGLERITNHSVEIKDINNKTEVENAIKYWKELCEQNRYLTEEQWIMDGFKKEGIELKNLINKENIQALVKALESKKWHIRYMANELLKKITGKDFETEFSEPLLYWHWRLDQDETRKVISQWKKWSETNK